MSGQCRQGYRSFYIFLLTPVFFSPPLLSITTHFLPDTFYQQKRHFLIKSYLDYQAHQQAHQQVHIIYFIPFATSKRPDSRQHVDPPTLRNLCPRTHRHLLPLDKSAARAVHLPPLHRQCNFTRLLQGFQQLATTFDRGGWTRRQSSSFLASSDHIPPNAKQQQQQQQHLERTKEFHHAAN